MPKSLSGVAAGMRLYEIAPRCYCSPIRWYARVVRGGIVWSAVRMRRGGGPVAFVANGGVEPPVASGDRYGWLADHGGGRHG